MEAFENMTNMGDSLTVDYTDKPGINGNGVHPSRKTSKIRKDLFDFADPDVVAFIDQAAGEGKSRSILWNDFKSHDGLGSYPESCTGFANLQRINDVRDINTLFEQVNRTLRSGDSFVICFESMHQRKMRIMTKFPAVFNGIYYFMDFILKRVFPKWGPTRKVYYWITGGRNRVLSLTEMLGRLMANGFSIVDYKALDNLTWVVSQKTGEPDYDARPTFGALCRLKRIGFGGEIFTVYKLRTMYAYSEYLQDYVFQKNDLQEGGKLRRDFRVTSWGRWFRRFWLDELPMLWNWLRGDMKLVGVRPLSRHYFDLYPEDLQKLRVRVRPGLVPPYYADMPETLDEIIASERTYIYSYLNKPVRTDVKYFFKAMYNIFIRGARSK